MPVNFMDTMHWALAVVYPACLVAAMIQDVKTLEISNKISILLAVSFVFCSLISDISVSAIFIHYGIGIVVFMIGAFLFAMGIIGGGDVKLLAAASIWLSMVNVVTLLLFMAIFGGILGVFVILLRRASFMGRYHELFPWLTKEEGLPYGVAIGIAGLYLFPRIPVLPNSMVSAFGF